MTIKPITEQFQARNVATARKVVDRVDQYGGETDWLVIWARAVLRHEAEQTARGRVHQ